MATIELNPVVYRLRPGTLSAQELLVLQRVMREIGLRLARITQDQGFLTNVGASVSYGELIDAEPLVIPSINYWSGEQNGVQDEYGISTRVVQVGIETYDKLKLGEDEKPDALADYAVKMHADVERALWMHRETKRPDPTLNGLAVGIAFSNDRPVAGVQPELWVGDISLWEVTYTTVAGNPYRQHEED